MKGLASYQGSSHTTPDTSHLVRKVADKVRDLELQKFIPGREGNAKVKKTINILARGEEQLKSSSLATFNKKIRILIEGGVFEDEVDTLPPISFAEAPVGIEFDDDIV